MNIKFYDLLSTLIVGIVIVGCTKLLYFKYTEIDSTLYIALGYIVGYFINGIGSDIQRIYDKIKKGKPSDILLTLVDGQNWTGYQQVKFYEAEKVIELLKKDLNDEKATTEKMFEYALRKINGSENSRVSDFNAQYVCSRSILAAIPIAFIICVFDLYNEWWFWLLTIVLLLLAIKRFKMRGYYYAREVLKEYLNQTEKSSN